MNYDVVRRCVAPAVRPPPFSLQSRRLDLLVTAALIGIVVLSRIAAFPASIWDQDEAYFATYKLWANASGSAF